MIELCNQHEFIGQFKLQKQNINNQLVNFSHLAINLGHIDKQYKFDLKSLIIPIKERFNFLLTKEEIKLINIILKQLDSPEINAQELSSNLITLSAKITSGRKYLNV